MAALFLRALWQQRDAMQAAADTFVAVATLVDGFVEDVALVASAY